MDPEKVEHRIRILPFLPVMSFRFQGKSHKPVLIWLCLKDEGEPRPLRSNCQQQILREVKLHPLPQQEGYPGEEVDAGLIIKINVKPNWVADWQIFKQTGRQADRHLNRQTGRNEDIYIES